MTFITLTLSAPYVGLRPFDEKDSLIFFGRDNHVRDLLAKLSNKQRFISVLGVSGTGKSSLVRAGLIPALHRGALASVGCRWKTYTFKPGDAPLHSLVHALTEDSRWIDNNDRAASESSLRSLLATSSRALSEQYRQRAESFNDEAILLVVDQFEEIFRYRQKNINEIEAFVQLLLRTTSDDVPVHIVMTMRSEFLGDCVTFFGLPEVINSGLYLTPRLEFVQLKSIITSPLVLVGGDIDPVLVNRLVNMLSGEDELPILEHALQHMWNHAKAAGRNRIEVQDFESVCAPPRHLRQTEPFAKVAFSIDNHASTIFRALTHEQQQLAKQMFLALVKSRDGHNVRRPQLFQQLAEFLGVQHDLRVVISAFRAEQAGFLLPPHNESVHDEVLIDISHESLFRQWHMFQQWLNDEAFDVGELDEWRQRAIRQQQGGDWLDEKDCIRANYWCERVNKRADPKQWAMRYGDASDYELVIEYIKGSVHYLNEFKLEYECLQRERQQAVTRQLEAEARLQRELAEQAEKDKQRVQAFAIASRRRSVIAMIAAAIAIVFAIVSLVLYSHAKQQKKRAEKAQHEAHVEKERAEKMARDARAGELIATAENLINSDPDKGILLGLAARRVSAISKADALLRFAYVKFNYRSLRGHEAWVLSAQFSADNRKIVTASADKSARIWDAATGKELHKLIGHESVVRSAQFSVDGQMIVTASWDKSVRIWDAADGQELHKLIGHEAEVLSAQFSVDGQMIVTASVDKSVRIWDVATGKELHRLIGHEAEVLGAQFSTDGQTIVTASRDGSARVWDVVTGRELHKLSGHEAEVLSAQFSADGQTIVTASVDKSARIWSTANGQELHKLGGHEAWVLNAQFSADGRTIVTASTDKNAYVWDVGSGKKLHKLSGHEAEIWNVQFSPDGQMIVTAGADKSIRVWYTATGELLSILIGHEADVLSVLFSSDNQTIVTASADKSVRVWNAASDKELYKLNGHEAEVLGAQFSVDGQMIVTASVDKSARVWSTINGQELHKLNGHEASVLSAQFSSDGRTIVTASADKTARVWDVATGQQLHVLIGHENEVLNAQFSSDGRMIVTASANKGARVWSTVNGQELHKLNGHEADVLSAQFSPNAQMIVTASADKTARVWDVATGQQLHVLIGHENEVLNAQFSLDGQKIMTVSNDESVRIWDAATGKELYALIGHEGEVLSAQFSPNAQMIATAGADKSVRIWDVTTGKELHKLIGHEGEVLSVQFSINGQAIVTASTDKSARVWDVATGKELYKLNGHGDRVLNAQFSSDNQKIVTASQDRTARVWRCAICLPIEDITTELQKRVGRELTEGERRRFGVSVNTFVN